MNELKYEISGNRYIIHKYCMKISGYCVIFVWKYWVEMIWIVLMDNYFGVDRQCLETSDQEKNMDHRYKVF